MLDCHQKGFAFGRGILFLKLNGARQSSCKIDD